MSSPDRLRKIEAWAKSNLRPGMTVKVKTDSAYKFRQIEEIDVQKGTLTGKHFGFSTIDDQERGKGYITVYSGKDTVTTHNMRYIQGLLSADDTGNLVVTNVSNLIG